MHASFGQQMCVGRSTSENKQMLPNAAAQERLWVARDRASRPRAGEGGQVFLRAGTVNVLTEICTWARGKCRKVQECAGMFLHGLDDSQRPEQTEQRHRSTSTRGLRLGDI
jgi:transposase